MSGIFAYTGSEPCRERLIDGLRYLERRGKELCGTAICNEDGIALFRIAGSPADLAAKAESIKSEGFTGLAACADAERAKPSPITSVPCADGRFAVAADGEIENLDSLKRRVNVSLPIVTDGDLLLALLTAAAEAPPLKRLQTALAEVEGNPTVVFLVSGENAVYCRAGNAPLAVGIYEDGVAAASELNALTGAKRYFILESGELARLTGERCIVYDERFKRVKKTYHPLPEIRYFENDFSLRDEVFCLPIAAKDTLGTLIKSSRLALDGTALSKRSLEKVQRILLTGTGDSYRAAHLAQHTLEQLCDIPCTAASAYDLRYAPLALDKSVLLIAVTQRGENADALACIKRMKTFGGKTLCVTASPYSSCAAACDGVLDTNTDFTAADVRLRSFPSAVLALHLLALQLGFYNGIISEIYLNVALKFAEMLPGKLSEAIKPTPALNALSRMLADSEKIVFSGPASDSALAEEAASKTRCLTGKTAVSLPLGELLQETDAYLKGLKLVAFITSDALLPKSLGLLRRLRLRGADITLITGANTEELLSEFHQRITFSDSLPLFSQLTAAACFYKAVTDARELMEADGTKAAG